MQLTLRGAGIRAAAAVEAFFGQERPTRLGVAVSGGGDSTALLLLLADWAKGRGTVLSVATVDHGLRAEAAAEAQAVARMAGAMGLSHATLRWTEGREDGGNLSDRARRARYALLAGWAAGAGIGTIALGHTRDDVAETLLMRLARGSGVDGLAAMEPRREVGGVAFVRPLLSVSRGDLREVLTERGVGWADDPTNDDPRHLRVRARAALAALEPLGLGAERLAATAGTMTLAREALRHLARQVAAEAARVEAGDLILDGAGLSLAPEETRLRLVAGGIRWLTGAEYRPRLGELRALLDGIGPRPRALAGCLLWRDGGALRLTREARAAGPAVRPGEVWDGRWRVTGPSVEVAEVRALGPGGLTLCPGAARGTGLPRATLLASPAVWAGGALIAAPLAGKANGWRAESLKDAEGFVASLGVS